MDRISNIKNAVATVKVANPDMDPDGLNGREYVVEGYWDDVTGGSWMKADGNFAAIKYAMRSGLSGLPLDDNVVYGKVDGLGHLLHQSELTFSE